MRRAPVAGLLAAAPTALVTAPSPASADPAPRPSHAVDGRLGTLRDRGLITPEAYVRARDRYAAARHTERRLRGRRRVELGAVLKTVEDVTRRGQLSASRVPLAFETLERNRQWWTTGALLGGDGATLRLELPFARKGELGLQKVGAELVVAVDGHRRTLLLPPALADYRATGARLADGALLVSFAPPA